MKKRLLLGALVIAAFGFTATSCSSDTEETGTNTPITGDPNNPTPNPNPNPTPGAKFKHKVLLEDITGTWCPACPIASSAINQAKSNAANGDKIVAAAIHIGQSNYPDPMQIQAGTNLYQSFFAPNYGEGGLFSFPTVTINRENLVWQQGGIAQFFNAINPAGSDVGIKINSELTTTGGNVTATFKFNQGYENLKYNVYVIEQNVRTSSAQQGSTEGTNYIHNDVLRAISGTATGNTLGTVTAGQEVVKANQTVNYTLFNNDLAKVEVIAFVTDATGKVLNVQVAKANTAVDYQYVQ